MQRVGGTGRQVHGMVYGEIVLGGQHYYPNLACGNQSGYYKKITGYGFQAL